MNVDWPRSDSFRVYFHAAECVCSRASQARTLQRNLALELFSYIP